MDLIADILLAAGAFGAAIYCLVLSRRLQRLTGLETGMGGAIAMLSAQVDDLTRALAAAQEAARSSAATLEAERARAEQAAVRIELLLAAMHDLPAESPPAAAPGGGAEGQRRARVVRHRIARGVPEPAE